MNRMPKRFSCKSLITVLALTLSIGCTVNGTLAWLADTSKLDTNVFTDGNISIRLEDVLESEPDVKMVPGCAIDKMPVVTVEAGSEDCYLFIKVEKNIGDVFVLDGNGDVVEDSHGDPLTYSFDDFIAFNVIDARGDVEGNIGWTKLTDEDGDEVEGVYYRVVRSRNVDFQFTILEKGEYNMDGTKYRWTTDQVLVLPDVTAEMMDAIDDENRPELSFTAYAIQYYKTNDTPFEAYEAWAHISN